MRLISDKMVNNVCVKTKGKHFEHVNHYDVLLHNKPLRYYRIAHRSGVTISGFLLLLHFPRLFQTMQ